MQETLLQDPKDTKQKPLHFLEQLEVPRHISILTPLLNESYLECQPLYDRAGRTFGENRNDPKVARLLVRATEFGNAVAYSRLLRQHYTSFGQDVGQLTAHKVYSHLWQFEQGSQFSTWVFRISFNFASGSARRRSAVTETDIDVAAGFSSFKRIVDPYTQSPLEAALETERISARLRLYMEARDKLSEEHRRIVELDDQNHSYLEMASELDIPIGTVRSRLSRARGKLEEILTQHMKGDWFSEFLAASLEKQKAKKAMAAQRKANSACSPRRSSIANEPGDSASGLPEET